MTEPIMRFGAHKGKPLFEIPFAYLGWLMDQPNFNGWLKRAVQAELTTREHLDLMRRKARTWAEEKLEAWGANSPPGVTRQAVYRVLKAGCHATATTYGKGSPEATEAVATARWLWKIVQEMLPADGGAIGEGGG